jgi:peptidyl-prolyl cis-trans isomerase C
VRIHRLSIVITLVLMVVLLAACAGDKKSSGSSASNSSNTVPVDQAVNTANSAGQASQSDPVIQSTEEPLAATVNGQPITLAAFQRERDRRSLGMQVEPATAAAFDATVLQTMIDQVVIEQAAARLGIVVTDQEVDSELALESDLAAANGETLDDFVAAQLYTMDEYRAALHGMLLTQKVSDSVVQVAPTSEQVHSRHILVADEATARSLLAQIQAGADFAQLAMQYSLDKSTAPTGGDLDWVSRGDLLQPEVENAIFSLEPGQIAPEPIHSSLGYHIIQTLEKVEDRPLSQSALAQKRQQAFLAWLDSQRQSAVIERYVGQAN